MSVLIAYAVPFFVSLLVLEAALSARHRRRDQMGYETRDTFASLSLGVANVVTSTLAKGLSVGVFYAFYQIRLFEIGSGWEAWAMLIVAEDFCYYWFHRCHHEVRLLWAAHVNHHSSRYFNLSTALRQSWTTPLTGPIFWVPLALLGFHPLMILTVQATSLIYQFWIHTEWIGRLGPLEWILNTPSHHRVHHGANTQYLDRNYAGVFIVWDRLFGSFEPEGDRVEYGILHNVESFNPIVLGFHEWVALLRDAWAAKSWRERLGYLLRPPGWSADGSSLTARQMRARWDAARANA